MLSALGKERTIGTRLVLPFSNTCPMKSPKKKAAKKSATRKPVAKKKTAVRAAAKADGRKVPAKATKPMRDTAAKKPARPAAPAKRTRTEPRPFTQRTAKPEPKPLLREKPAPSFPSLPGAERPVYAPPSPERPVASYDPTPDTTLHQRGQTSIPHNAQSERAAALKGQRARIGGRRK